MVLLAALMAWYCAVTSRDGLLAAGDSQREPVGGVGSAPGADVGVAELWSRERRALVIFGLTAVLGALTALAVILVVVVSEWPASGQSVTFFAGRVAGVLEGIASLLPAVASVVIFGHVRGIWSDLVSAVELADASLESPRQPPASGLVPPSSALGPRRRL
jgi:hypothetical protein